MGPGRDRAAPLFLSETARGPEGAARPAPPSRGTAGRPLPHPPATMPTEPISIVGLFEDAVSTSSSGDSITSIVLRLSHTPDEAWVEAFHHEWALTSYPRKRSARVGTVRARSGGPARTGLVLSSSPADYVGQHKDYLEDAVERANERQRQRDRQRDETVAEAARTIREINRAYYGGPEQGGPDAGLRLAV